MPSVKYLHTSMFGSYWIDCVITEKCDDDNYVIEFFDPVGEELVSQTVVADRLKFPKFSEYIM